jgi:predicted metal-dependent peptidase
VNDDLESFKSDGAVLEYREEYLCELSVDEMAFVFANGAMHTSLAHQQRKSNRSGWLWQMATDIAINDMLLNNGLEMPYGAEYRKRFAGMYAEEIYEELKEDILRDELEYEVEDEQDVEPNDEQREKDELLLEEQLRDAEAVALLERLESRDELPLGIEQFFLREYEGRVDWREELRVALDTHFRDNYTLLPPNKKFLSQGIYLPSLISQTFRLVIVVDSSASIDEQLLGGFLAEINFLMGVVGSYHIELIVADDRVQTHRTFQSGEALEVELQGGGGTDFTPAFAFVEQNFDDVRLLLYFTDLDGIFPQEIPTYDVKWVSSSDVEVPFGEVIVFSSK